MRIALVILRADRSRGGAETYTLGLADALRARGYAADVVYADGVSGRTRLGRFRAFQRRVRLLREAGGHDVVHAMLPIGPGLCDIYHPHAGVAAERSRRLSWWANPRRRAFARAERDMLEVNHPPVTITLSDYVERALRRHHPKLPTGRTFRLFNGVDLSRFAPDGPVAALSGDPPRALFVGNDFHRKGLDIVLAALRDAPRWRLAVAGQDRKSATQFARVADILKVEDRVEFLGSRADLPELYRAADVLVHASRHDPCSLATLEALASGLPVVGGANDGAMEVVTPGVEGFVVKALRPDDAAAQLAGHLTALQDPARRASMREACLRLRPRLSWEAHVDRLLELYEQVRS